MDDKTKTLFMSQSKELVRLEYELDAVKIRNRVLLESIEMWKNLYRDATRPRRTT